MNQVAITVKIDSNVKKEAQALAKRLGLSLSAIIENNLKETVRERRVVFEDELEPTPHLERIMKEVESDLKTGKNITKTNSEAEVLDYLKTLAQ